MHQANPLNGLGTEQEGCHSELCSSSALPHGITWMAETEMQHVGSSYQGLHLRFCASDSYLCPSYLISKGT